MRPVLFSILGLDVQTYGASKALAALAAAYLLGRAFERAGLKKDSAHSLVLWATIWGFVGAKIYHLLEQGGNITLHHLGGTGFTWYGGLVGGILAALVVIRRHGLPVGVVAGAAAAPLSVAYAIGRLGCFFSGDGTWGTPSSLPWAMTFPNGVVATDVPVHPTPLYEAVGAIVIAVVLWALGRRWNPPAVFGSYLVLSGIARFLVEMVRTNAPSLFGLTQPQLWALASVVIGTVLVAATRPLRRSDAGSTAPDPVPAASARG
ncbi:MAG: prolipoprotein diacylglyceryl transferase [Georgenia sp.]